MFLFFNDNDDELCGQFITCSIAGRVGVDNNVTESNLIISECCVGGEN